MAVFYSGTHTNHLNFLKPHPADILLSFARASVDYLMKGANIRSYTNVAKKFNVSVERIQNAVESFAYILIECYKHDVDRRKLNEIFCSLEFNNLQTAALVDFYEEQKPMLEKLFTKSNIESFFYDLQWRFEAKIGSRSLLNQMAPIVTLNLKTSDNSRAALSKDIKNNLLQTDPSTLIHLTNTLEKAMQFSQSSAARKIEKKVKKLVPNN